MSLSTHYVNSRRPAARGEIRCGADSPLIPGARCQLVPGHRFGHSYRPRGAVSVFSWGDGWTAKTGQTFTEDPQCDAPESAVSSSPA